MSITHEGVAGSVYERIHGLVPLWENIDSKYKLNLMVCVPFSMKRNMAEEKSVDWIVNKFPAFTIEGVQSVVKKFETPSLGKRIFQFTNTKEEEGFEVIRNKDVVEEEEKVNTTTTTQKEKKHRDECVFETKIIENNRIFAKAVRTENLERNFFDLPLTLSREWKKILCTLSDKNLQQVCETLEEFTHFEYSGPSLPLLSTCFVRFWYIYNWWLLSTYREQWMCPLDSTSVVLKRFFEEFPPFESEYKKATVDLSEKICSDGWLPIINNYPLHRWFPPVCLVTKHRILTINKSAPSVSLCMGWWDERSTPLRNLRLLTSDNRMITISIPIDNFEQVDVEEIYTTMNKINSVRVLVD